MKTEPTESLSIKRANIVDKYLPAGDEQRYYERLKMHEELVDLINSHCPKIKQLEWEFHGIYYSAQTAFGAYILEENEENENMCDLYFGNLLLRNNIPVNEAKCIAQQKFETKIKECLM